MLVKDENITVVIQGDLFLDHNSSKYNVLNCILSLKKILPASRIVVSTWENEKKHEDKLINLVDKIVYSKLPDAIKSLDISNNINRQVVSTLSGLNEVKTKYALKIRANFSLDSKSSLFLETDKINILEMVHDPIYTFNLFSLPDYIQFAKIDKLKIFWNLDIKENDFFTQKRFFGIFNNYSYPYNFKFSPEQYLGINWLKKNYGIDVLIEHKYDVNYVDFLLFKDILAKDFNFISYKNSGIVFNESYYLNSNFIENTEVWLKNSSRKQFLKLLFRKYILSFFKKNFYLSLFKLLVYKMGLFNKLKKGFS
ncbi:WavE lipopolysaccharide synthesis family protein [Aliarcobacter butzleri]|uniref:WavE lipopolysaccharide synthesis family protein n=1 Tax=Aliarcobacter butzleri TaxID=28197 RepID=UPI0021B4FAEC|nr:WavE lipopolysaccharide synthesis family protein [Aliarcobacter butzleri]MCT7592484.1 WavE lipopolysaccharide synthesis family protein [Aliarcobacter butzleri]